MFGETEIFSGGGNFTLMADIRNKARGSWLGTMADIKQKGPAQKGPALRSEILN
jgi:hypothetical protein